MDNAHALVIGIANYEHVNKLPPTVLTDAKDIRDLLIDLNHCGYPSGNVRLLLDGQATGEAIRQELADLAVRSDQDSTIFFYISSHGGRVESGPYTGKYLLPVDTVYTSGESVAQTAISGAEFTEALRAVPARKVVVVFDCCHAGGIGQPKDATAPAIKALPESYYDTLKEGRGRVILASSRSTEYSWVMSGAKNSLFTQHLLDGLRGCALGTGGVIRIFDLFDYIYPRVAKAQPNQHPIFKAEIEENFGVALFMGGKAATPIPTTSPPDEYQYDVFISYSSQKPDRTWVRKTLLPRLEAEGLRVSLDFRAPLGVPKIIFRENAIQESRYTILLLSEAYLDSDYGEFENLVAHHLDLEESQYRLLPLLIEECTPRLGLRILPMLDMSDEDEFEENIDRLIYQLRQPPVRRRR
jgi:hypothetical protein